MGPAALFLCALLLGGGGPHAPILTGTIEAVAIVVLFRLFAADGRWLVSQAGSGIAAGLVSGLLLIAVAQLVPLPARVWQHLPGRALLLQAMQVLGRADQPWPISLSPPDTRMVLFSLLPPVALFFAALRLPIRNRIVMAELAVLVGLASTLLGFAQLLAGDGSFFPYGLPPFSRSPGLFANFNHQATFLACCLLLAAALAMEPTRRRVLSNPFRTSLILFLLVAGALVTSSRAGLALLVLAGVIALLLSIARWRSLARASPGHRDGWHRKRLLIFLSAIAVSALVVALAAGSYRWDLMADRFGETAGDSRFLFWPNVCRAIRLYFPVGTGLGTFETVYAAVEPLSQVQGWIVNHAHNDYLEFVLEAGLPGLILMTLAGAWLAWRALIALRRPAVTSGTMLARAAAAIVLLILLHSIVDYPLRTEAIACLFAFACALLVPPPEGGSGHVG